ncbi:TPA: hypothetical protein NJY08_005160 [Salmonella enterica subsp. enterica serovar Typhi str. AG3]|nr:hypothetical protein [Salmonella enterica subsp. enterica serovar Typhi str. AG3]
MTLSPAFPPFHHFELVEHEESVFEPKQNEVVSESIELKEEVVSVQAEHDEKRMELPGKEEIVVVEEKAKVIAEPIIAADTNPTMVIDVLKEDLKEPKKSKKKVEDKNQLSLFVEFF